MRGRRSIGNAEAIRNNRSRYGSVDPQGSLHVPWQQQLGRTGSGGVDRETHLLRGTAAKTRVVPIILPPHHDRYPSSSSSYGQKSGRAGGGQDEFYNDYNEDTHEPFRFPQGPVPGVSTETINFNVPSQVTFWKQFNIGYFLVAMIPPLLLSLWGFSDSLEGAVMGAGVGLLLVFCWIVGTVCFK